MPPFDLSHYAWTNTELAECFIRLKEQTSVSTKFCFFIDGLDEYNGDHQDIVDLLNGIAQSNDIKICLSSRPWNVFQAAFGGRLDRRLKLEDFTRDDIKRFAEDRLGQNSHFKALQASDPRYQCLLEEIVDAAQGVFLWVFLVVRSLLRGLTNADTISELQKRLRVLPSDLEQFFRHILDTTEEIYQERAAQFFLIANQANGPLSLMTYSFVDEEDPDFALLLPFSPMAENEKLDRLRRMKIRLNAQCNGLLECVSTPKSRELDSLLEGDSQRLNHDHFISPVFLSQAYRVEFLHRTVRDFIATKDMALTLRSRCGGDFKPEVSICRAVLAELKGLDCKGMPAEHLELILPKLFQILATNAYEAEVRYNLRLIEVLDSVELVFKTLSTEVVLPVLKANSSEALGAMLTKADNYGFINTMWGRLMICGTTAFKFFIVQSRLVLNFKHKFSNTSGQNWCAKDAILCALLPRPFEHEMDSAEKHTG
jgi:hypothetical protein